MKLSLQLPSANNTAVGLTISGELDQNTLTKDYWSALQQSEVQAIVNSGAIEIDLANVERSDTAGLAWLINIAKDARANKVKVSFKSVPDKLLNLAELSGAKQILA